MTRFLIGSLLFLVAAAVAAACLYHGACPL